MTDGLKGNQYGRIERVASWLPFYHDMGLIGCMLTPICCQFSVDLLHTDDFARSPLQWLKLIAKNKASLSFGPTFGYEICARRASRMRDDSVDLSEWRVAGIGGEMVHAHPLNAFAEAFAPYGFKPEAFTPSYGMAEATLAISFSDVDAPIHVDAIDKDAMLEGKAVPTSEDTVDETSETRVMVSCGRMLKGYELQIRDGADNILEDRQIGRICIDRRVHV